MKYSGVGRFFHLRIPETPATSFGLTHEGAGGNFVQLHLTVAALQVFLIFIQNHSSASLFQS